MINKITETNYGIDIGFVKKTCISYVIGIYMRCGDWGGHMIWWRKWRCRGWSKRPALVAKVLLVQEFVCFFPFLLSFSYKAMPLTGSIQYSNITCMLYIYWDIELLRFWIVMWSWNITFTPCIKHPNFLNSMLAKILGSRQNGSRIGRLICSDQIWPKLL